MIWKCQNGNRVERFYDRPARSSVTRVLDPNGDQIGDADYSGNKVTAAFVKTAMIKEQGGLAPKPKRQRKRP